MHSLTHALNIGTLATWMSVAGFGGLGVLIGRAAHEPVVDASPGVEQAQDEIEIESFEMREDPVGDAAKAVEPSEIIDLPAPPEIMPATESQAMPEVPDLPIAEVKKISESIKVAAKPNNMSLTQRKSTGRKSASAAATSGQAPTMTSAARLAAGRMPAPRYPYEARSKGQSGTVTVEFTVDSSGRVSSAHVCSPCPWSVLNQEALRAVKNWKFPPGGVVTYKKPIVFKLRNS